ncbi:MAG: hypothetical protein CL610_02800 [Anaerolineaceae bacterium]|nr:hypothetical protein [Anaerolineaceae bacterium]
MDVNQKLWNATQKELRQKLPRTVDFDRMKLLLLRHHAMVHAAVMARAGVWSFEDLIWQGVDDTDARRIPTGQEHSIIWVMWHIARIEDVTMNFLVSGCLQVLQNDNWLEGMNIPFYDTGNEISTDDMALLNTSMNVAVLKAYRIAVGQRTQVIIRGLQPAVVRQKVDPARIRQLRDSGAVVPAASGIIDYWSKRTIAGLLLMPATRHNFIHLNEATRIKRALGH